MRESDPWSCIDYVIMTWGDYFQHNRCVYPCMSPWSLPKWVEKNICKVKKKKEKEKEKEKRKQKHFLSNYVNHATSDILGKKKQKQTQTIKQTKWFKSHSQAGYLEDWKLIS